MAKGFTLIELLVTISIVGLLASFGLMTYPNVQKQGRDTQRKSDLGQYRNALETYAGSNDGTYPVSLVTITALCGVLSPDFIASCPADPLSPTYNYEFYSSADGAAYVIYAKLEAGAGTDYWEVCSTGKSGKLSAAPPTWDSSCDL